MPTVKNKKGAYGKRTIIWLLNPKGHLNKTEILETDNMKSELVGKKIKTLQEQNTETHNLVKVDIQQHT